MNRQIRRRVADLSMDTALPAPHEGSEIIDNIWLGDVGLGRQAVSSSDLDFKRFIILGGSDYSFAPHARHTNMYLPDDKLDASDISLTLAQLHGYGEGSPNYLEEVCRFLDEARVNDRKVLIFAAHGASHAVLLLAFYLVKQVGLTVDETLELLLLKYPAIDSNLSNLRDGLHLHFNPKSFSIGASRSDGYTNPLYQDTTTLTPEVPTLSIPPEIQNLLSSVTGSGSYYADVPDLYQSPFDNVRDTIHRKDRQTVHPLAPLDMWSGIEGSSVVLGEPQSSNYNPPRLPAGRSPRIYFTSQTASSSSSLPIGDHLYSNPRIWSSADSIIFVSLDAAFGGRRYDISAGIDCSSNDPMEIITQLMMQSDDGLNSLDRACQAIDAAGSQEEPLELACGKLDNTYGQLVLIYYLIKHCGKSAEEAAELMSDLKALPIDLESESFSTLLAFLQ
jgi:hypothetical protein